MSDHSDILLSGVLSRCSMFMLNVILIMVPIITTWTLGSLLNYLTMLVSIGGRLIFRALCILKGVKWMSLGNLGSINFVALTIMW